MQFFFIIYIFIIMFLSFTNFVINKYPRYIPTMFEHFSPQVSYWKVKWLSLQKCFKATDVE
jgi:hypothetical protein